MIGRRIEDVPLTCNMLFLVVWLVWQRGDTGTRGWRKSTTDRVTDRVTDIKNGGSDEDWQCFQVVW